MYSGIFSIPDDAVNLQKLETLVNLIKYSFSLRPHLKEQ